MDIITSKRNKQPINGILLVNKPKDLTSNAVLQRVKRIYNAAKAGHTGSLDPLATGMLPICFGEATKFSQYLLDADKCYETTGLLGIKTNTADATGEIIAQNDDFSISQPELQIVLNKFIGTIKQIPSMFSALKHHGTPLYKFARKGVDIERPAREVMIHQLELNHFNGKEFDLTVSCSKGTYIRNLVEDIGQLLGTYAHVTRLHRTYTLGFAGETMYTLDEINDKTPEQLDHCLLPLDRAINHLQKINLSSEEAIMLRQGKVLNEDRFGNESGIVRLYKDEDILIGLGEFGLLGLLKVKRLVQE